MALMGLKFKVIDQKSKFKVIVCGELLAAPRLPATRRIAAVDDCQ